MSERPTGERHEDGEEPSNTSPPARRTRAALRRIQRRIENYYELERAPDVVDFTEVTDDGREQLLVRQLDADLELALVVPSAEPRVGANDVFLQLLEGVSHFVHVAERARTGLPTTQLELELQAEVDKFVLLALDRRNAPTHSMQLHRHLYASGVFLHGPDTEQGERYRLANDLAARFAARLVEQRSGRARELLRRFYRVGLTDKIALVRAA